MVFPDIHPIAPIHLLVLPKKHVEDFLMLEDGGLMIKVLKTIQDMIKKVGLTDKGYRFAVNGGGAQIIEHVHAHVIGPLGKEAKLK